MKKIFTILCAAVIAASAVNAEVLLTEHFAQATETLATNENVFAEEIAATGWTNINGSGQIYMNTTKDLTYAGYKSATDKTGSVEYKATFGKKAARAFKAVNSGSVFMSAIINVTGAAGSATARDYISALCTKTSAFSNANNPYLRIEDQAEGEGYKLGIAKQAESAAFISYTGEMTFGKNYLVVAEYRWVDGEKNDSVFLYINPTKDGKAETTLVCKQSATNATGGEVGSGTKADADQLTSVMLYASASTKQSMFIDELKVATAWADLFEAGDAPVVETPTISTESSVAFGEVTTGVEAVKSVTVQGSYLTDAISVASSDEQVAVSVTSISKEEAEAEKLLSDSILLSETGCFAVVLEKVPAKLAAEVTKAIKAPTIGIGAGGFTDGQILVIDDMLGKTQGFSPRFLRRYANLNEVMTNAIGQYVTDVKSNDFPNEQESY